jgi:tripartite-type tricarboxylate transporter receptor subunit TctC
MSVVARRTSEPPARTILLLWLRRVPGTHGATLADTPNSLHRRDFPTKPVRIIEPFGIGGDPTCWLVAGGAQAMGSIVMVENHPGAGATRPALVAKSPDGYATLNAAPRHAALSKNLL